MSSWGSHIDWAATGSWMQAWAAFGQDGILLLGAIKGADVVKSWRRQKIVERELDTAERILDVAYKVRRAFAYIRSPMMSGDELAQAEAHLRKAAGDWFARLPPERQRTATYGQAIHNRVLSHAADFTELLATTSKARAFFGPEVEDQLHILWRQRSAVLSAAESYSDDRGGDPAFTEQIKRAIWENWGSFGGRGRNELDDAIAAAFQQLEERLRPVLRESVAETKKGQPERKRPPPRS